MLSLFRRSSLVAMSFLLALVVATVVPAGASNSTVLWDPPILVDHPVPGGIVQGAAGYVSVDPHPFDDLGESLETTMFFSADGFSWDEETVISSARLSGVAAGGPGFVAVGSRQIAGTLLGPTVWVSSDGQKWSEVDDVPEATAAGPAQALPSTVDSPFTGSWMTDVASDGSILVAVGRDVAGRGAVWTSSDGIAWTPVTGTPLGDAEVLPVRVAAGASGWMVMTGELIDADAPGPITTWWSADGTSWSRVDDDASFGADVGFGPFIRGLIGYEDGFVMVGNLASLEPVAWVSNDGSSWNAPETLPTSAETDSSFVSDVATDGDSLVVVGDDVVFDPGLGPATSDAAIWTSDSGSEWAQVEPNSLRGDVTLHDVHAWAVHTVDGWWVVHGTTNEVGGEPVPVVWVGRPHGAGTFADVPPDHLFFADVEWLSASGITRSCNPPFDTLFCPSRTVTRGQMAAFLVRGLGLTDDGGGDLFVDDDGSIFEPDIDKLGAAGITRSCNPPDNDKYCPGAELTRGQAAAFLVRGLGLTDDGGGDLFVDDDGSIFEPDIDKLGAAGITRSCNPPDNDKYCPSSELTRAQMAAFLRRAFE